jgi:hypothetical protein
VARLCERGGEILVDPLGVDVADRVEADVPDAGTGSGGDPERVGQRRTVVEAQVHPRR